MIVVKKRQGSRHVQNGYFFLHCTQCTVHTVNPDVPQGLCRFEQGAVVPAFWSSDHVFTTSLLIYYATKPHPALLYFTLALFWMNKDPKMFIKDSRSYNFHKKRFFGMQFTYSIVGYQKILLPLGYCCMFKGTVSRELFSNWDCGVIE